MEIILELETIILVHNEVIRISGGDTGTQNTSGIEFALDHIKYNNTKKEFFHNLALLFRNITNQHPFVDGNKRTGLVIVESALEDNEMYLKLTDKQKEKLVLDIAKGKFTDLEKLSKYLERHSKKYN